MRRLLSRLRRRKPTGTVYITIGVRDQASPVLRELQRKLERMR